MFKKIFLILIIIIIVGAVIAFLGLTGRSEFASNLMGMNKPEDLGVTYSDEDLDSLAMKIDPRLGEEGYVPAGAMDMGDMTYVPVNASISESEVSAYINQSLNQIMPVDSLQVSFGSVHLSGMTNVDEIVALLNQAGMSGGVIDQAIELFEEGAPVPFYVTLELTVTDGMYYVSDLQGRIGRVSVTAALSGQDPDTVNSMVQSAMESLGFNLTTFEAGDGEAYIEGLIAIDHLRVRIN